MSDSRFVMLHYIVVVGEGVGISFYKTNQSSISDCNVHPKEEGIDLLYTNSVSILHTSIIKGSTGIQMTATQNINISYTIVRNITKFGIYIINSTNITVSSVDILFSLQSGGTSVYTIYSTSTIINNITILNGKNGIRFSNSRKAIVKGTKVFSRIIGILCYNTTDIEVKNVTTMKSSLAIYVMSSSHCTISRVVLCNCQSRGILLRHTTDSYISDVVVKNSTLEGIYVRNATNIIIRNVTMTSDGYIKLFLVESSHISIQYSNFTNFSTPWATTDVFQQPAVIELHKSHTVMFENSRFEGNTISCLRLIDSEFTVNGTLIFEGNRAYTGAAMLFAQNSYLKLSENSLVVFRNNRAATTGGAIHIISTERFYVAVDGGVKADSFRCFLKVSGVYTESRLIFKNNTAMQGGDILYGGSLERACTVHSSKTLCKSCLQRFKNISTFIPNNSLSSITSDPSRVCFCESATPDCLTLFHPTQFVRYSGEVITISAVIVGQDFGTVPGSVYANFFHFEASNSSEVEVLQRDQSQGVKHGTCNNLTYTILSDTNSIQRLVLVLTIVNKREEKLLSSNTIATELEQYQKYINGGLFPLNLLSFPIYINITLFPCPPGFSSTVDNPQCDCTEQLQQLPDISCDIQYNTITRRGLVWVGARIDKNHTITHIITSSRCPLNYCKKDAINVNLSRADSQCSYNRSGILCGQCQPGLSLALGSNQCLQCSNTYLALLVPFALAGIVLMFFIKVLDLTISQGFINGFIFYANIVKANEHLLVPQAQVNPLTLFISWLNL